MKFDNLPSNFFLLDGLPRYCGGKPSLDRICWFRDHVYWHENAVMDADFICFVLEDDPGEKIETLNGVLKNSTNFRAPYFGSLKKGDVVHTYSTVRRNELTFKYCMNDMTLPDFPFKSEQFILTPRFLELLHRLFENMDFLREPGMADHQDFLALELLAEARASHEKIAAPGDAVDPRIYKIANKIAAHSGEIEDVERLASYYGFSRAAFYREWKKFSPVPPSRTLLETRLKTAESLLSTSHLTIKEIAARAGFRSPAVFTEIFKQHFRTSPRDYRKTR